MDDTDRKIACERFILDHHHLLSPWAYTWIEFGNRQRLLMVRNVSRETTAAKDG